MPSPAIVEFTNVMELLLSKLSKNKVCFIAGDFNINLMKFESDNNVANYLDTIVTNNFIPALLLPTRLTSTTQSLIDLIYFNNKSKNFNISCGNLYSDLSDHLPNFAVLKSFSRAKLNFKDRPQIRHFTAKNKKKFSDHLNSIDWEPMYLND